MCVRVCVKTVCVCTFVSTCPSVRALLGCVYIASNMATLFFFILPYPSTSQTVGTHLFCGLLVYIGAYFPVMFDFPLLLAGAHLTSAVFLSLLRIVPRFSWMNRITAVSGSRPRRRVVTHRPTRNVFCLLPCPLI